MKIEVHIDDVLFLGNSVSDDRLLGQSISLGCVLIPGRLVSQGLDKLVGEDFDIGPFVAGFFDLHRFLLHFKVSSRVFDLLGVLHVFERDQSSVGVAPENSLVPHKVVINEFTELSSKVHFFLFILLWLWLFVFFLRLYHFWGCAEIVSHSGDKSLLSFNNLYNFSLLCIILLKFERSSDRILWAASNLLKPSVIFVYSPRS